MAENSGSGGEKGISKALFRKIGRTKEKVMQNLLNADRTTDSNYDQLVTLFNEQHNVANRLQKEVKNYMTQVKAMSVASQSMYEIISESYEGSWKNADKLTPAAEEMVALWVDRVEKLNNDLQVPLSRYVDQFRDVKKKIEKRGRKLMDYDGKRHTVESLENAKKRDETKINKAHDEMYAARSIYETIHNELCEELPALYQSRIPTLCNYFGSLIRSEAAFQMDCAKVKTRLAELIEGSEAETTMVVSRSPAVKKPSNKTPPRPPVVQRSVDHPPHAVEKQLTVDRTNSVVGGGDQSNEYLTLVEFGGNTTTVNRIESDESDDDDDKGRRTGGHEPSPSHSTDSAKGKAASATSSLGSSGRIGGSNRELEEAAANPMTFHSSNSSLDSNPKNASRTDGMKASSEVSIDRKSSKASIEEKLLPAEKEESKAETPSLPAAVAAVATENGKRDSVEGGAVSQKSSDNVRHLHKSSSSSEDEEEEKTKDGANYLYKVVAIHNYTAEDADELSFEKGEVIGILPFEESSDEQDEGWLFGVKSTTGEKGVFPINFTSRA